MSKIIENLKKVHSNEELFEIALKLEKAYAPYKLAFLGWDFIFSYFPNNSYDTITKISLTTTPHKFINDLVLSYCGTERVIKYHLAKSHLKNNDEICVFEFKVNDSRLDFGVINGSSYAYEIKTERDNTTRLKKQIKDYKKVFEYVSVVTHECHIRQVMKTVGSEIGILQYKLDMGSCEFFWIRQPKINRGVQKKMQIEHLNTPELSNGILLKGISKNEIPIYKNSRRNKINSLYNKSEINDFFKYSIKLRQEKKWGNVKSKFNILHPIDLQECYSNFFDPDQCYTIKAPHLY
ncbi:MAG: sce7726 family protein [Clostridiales bacterium]|nr:sce7726 family protein [Clostridiales bacterium]